MGKASKALSSFVASLRFEDLPNEVISSLHLWALDTIGCGMNGAKEPSNHILLSSYKDLDVVKGSTVWNSSMETDAATAAMLNGALSHTIELDDDHRTGTIHTGVVVWPTVFALGEEFGISGKEALTAAAAGYETGIRIGRAFLGNMFYQGFHPTGVCGVFAAAAAAGKILGLTEEQQNHAFGIAGSMASGNREWKTTGAWTKRIQAGHANWGGVRAAKMAKCGFTGPSDFLEGQFGLFNAYSYQKQYDAQLVMNGLGEGYELLDNSLKPHASCRFAQPIIDSTLNIVLANDIQPDDIAHIRVGVGKNSLLALTEPADRKYRPQNRVDAQFSLPYAAAVAVHRRKAFIDEYQPHSFTDLKILSTADKVSYFLDPWAESLWPMCYAASVEIETTKGARLFDRTDYPKGDPENPMTAEEVVTKFNILMQDVGLSERADEISRSILALSESANISPTIKLLQ